MKKLLSVVIALTLVLSMGLVAFGVENGNGEPPYDMKNIELDKVIEKNGIIGDLAIDGEYTLEFGAGSVSGASAGVTAPILANVTSVNGKFIIPFNQFEVFGVYTYAVKEVAGDTAGMTYDGRDLVLTVYVVRDGQEVIKYATMHEKDNDKMTKIDTIDNKFDAGKLSITKDVTGNMGETDRYFEVKVTLNNPENKTVRNIISANGDLLSYRGADDTTNPTTIAVGEETSFWIKDGETIELTNIPEGVTYNVVEPYPGDNYDDPGYDGKENGTIIGEISTTITNNRGEEILTGINLDNLPYILILGAATVGLFGFTMKRRFNK